MTNTFTAPQDGTYLAMTVVGRLVNIHWSLRLKTGEIMAHPSASHVLMVVASPEGTEQPKMQRDPSVDLVRELRDMAPSLRHKIWHDNFCHCGCSCQKEA